LSKTVVQKSVFTMKNLTLFLSLILFVTCDSQQKEASIHRGDIIQLWPEHAGINDPTNKETILPESGDGNIRVTDINTPSMEYFPAPESGRHTPIIILCPGGGYKYLVVSRMTVIAKWLNDHGISAYVLKYRAPGKREEAFQDLQRAIRIVRFRALEWNIDPKLIGVMGSSAGGHLAARASTGFDIKAYQAVDEMDSVSSRPNFTVLLYPAYMNKGKVLKQEFTVSSELAPTLIISAKGDKEHFPGSPLYAKALKDAGASVRVHFFESGGHGFGLQSKTHPFSTWTDLCLEWFSDIGVLGERVEQGGADNSEQLKQPTASDL